MTEDSLNRTTTNSDVFVSYASADAAVANSIVEKLEQHGLICWLAPRNVKPGAVYAEAIVRAINEAKALVLVLSVNTMASAHVSREIERAASRRKQIIAFRVDATPLSEELEYFLSNSQWIDVSGLGRPAALAKLAEAVGTGPPPTKAMDAEIPAKRKMKRLVALAAVGLVVGAAVVLGVHFWSSKQSAAQAPAVGSSAANAPASVAISDKSIAVLPFADLSEKHDQEYFAAGMAQEITDLLSKMPGLRVVGRASACQFSGTSGDPHSIGAKLGAAYLVEGSVRHSGSRIRVSAQLCKNVRQMAVPWAVRYRT